MKIGHISDIHIRGSVRHDEVRKTTEDFIEQAKQKKLDHIIISGDIFHTKTSGITPESIDLLVWFFQELSKVAKVHVTLGNHDGVIHNMDKQDAITPIIKAIQNDNVILYKNSGVYPISDKVDLSVYGIFDKSNWELAQKTDSSKFNIGTFHGPVAGCVTDLNWMLDAEASVEYFSMHDVVMLGDIHKQQFLDSKNNVPRMGYPGSFMQNDFGEGIERHWLLWDIDEDKKTWTVSVENLLNSKPFVTIDSIENCTIKNGRYKIRTTEDLSPADKSKMRAQIKNILGSSDVVFELDKNETSLEQAQATSSGSLTDSSAIVDYCKKSYPDTNKGTLAIIKSAIDNCSKSESNGTVWSMEKLEFENVLGYGESNSINFTGLKGFVGLFGPNKIGKSSLVGAILYSLFNVVDRGTNKSHSVINTNYMSCRADMTISTNTEKLQITRQTIKTKTKNKESSNTQLNLCELITNTDLTLDQRAATDKIIEKKLGNIDDFRVASISTQNSIASFLDETPGERRKILSRHIGLDKIEEAYQSIQTEFNSIKSQMKMLTAKLEETNLVQIEEQLSSTEQLLVSLESDLENKSNEQRKFLIENKEKLQLVDKQKTLESDLFKAKSQLEQCKNSIERVLYSIGTDQKWISENENKVNELDSISKEILDKEKLNQKMLELWTQVKSIKDSIAKVEKDKKTLSVVPCGDDYPTCPFIKDAYRSVKESNDLEGNLNDLMAQIEEGKKSNADFDFLKSKRDELIRISSQLPMKQKMILKSEEDLQSLLSQKPDLEEKIETAQSELNQLGKPEVETTINFDKTISDIKTEISKQNVIKGGLIQKIESFKKTKSEIDLIETNYKNYELAALILSKKGIQTKLLSDNIQYVNNKIKSYLSPHFNFTVEFEIDETNGDAEATIVCDNGDRRSLNLGSGMERTTGCIAIRAAIHSVSVLPKSNFMIIDEGFGSIEGDNVTSTINCIKDISKDFKFVLVISHLQTVKDFVDSSITIEKSSSDGQSRINFGN